MTPLATAFLLLNAMGLLILPRRLACLPLIVGACYITRAQGIEIGPLSFTVLRILVVVGVARVLMRGERILAANAVDWLMAAWGIWVVLSGFSHEDAVINRLGLAFDGWGLYFLFRTLCRSREEVVVICVIVAVVLGPIAAEMLTEKATGRNLFAVFGGVPESPVVRNGRIRAQGPFAHSILAGNIGAVSLPLMVGLWGVRRRIAVFGTAVCLAMIFSSASSGPIMSALVGVGALMLWPWRAALGPIKLAAVFAYLGLELVMEDPAYFIMARIDLSGGSTGWHRARLIESAFQHLSEWWLVGTDYTRHWMATGVSWSPNHTDITNHYLRMGVLGGLLLMVLFIMVMLKGFSLIGKEMRIRESSPSPSLFMTWAAGASLFAHAATCISVSYFDQSIVFLYLTLAIVGAVTGIAEVPEMKTDQSVTGVQARWIPPKVQIPVTSSTI